MSKKSSKRPWRKLVKKLQRKRKRQKLASQRDKEFEEAELEKLKDPFYKSWLEHLAAMENQQERQEEIVSQELEEMWLRRELLAQQQFKRDELKRKTEEAKLDAERLKQEEELKLQEEIRKKKREKIKLQADKAAKEFENIMTRMKEYMEDVTMKTPTRLNIIIETRPGEKSCEFFEKTNCCRFDPGCTFNHKKPLLAKIILIKHFFQHPLLKQEEHIEYSKSDSDLELSERDLRDAYDEFCEDVWPVLEEFGSIINFRAVRNVHAHLRGHVFVEYVNKRCALKAFTSLQNRYYASKRLNVEFSNLQQWHKGVCGMGLGLSLSRKCPKGDKCNFLHIMKNINNKYNQPINNPERSLRKTPQTVQETTSWDREEIVKSRVSHPRDWRWSESPEIELKSRREDENFETKSENEKPSSYSKLRKSVCSDSRSASTKSEETDKSSTISYSRRNSKRDKTSCKRKSESSSPRHHKKHTKRKKSKDRKEEKKSSHRKRRSPH